MFLANNVSNILWLSEYTQNSTFNVRLFGTSSTFVFVYYTAKLISNNISIVLSLLFIKNSPQFYKCSTLLNLISISCMYIYIHSKIFLEIYN
jgi:hypothetical protein